MLVVLTQSADEATSMDDATRLFGLAGFRVVSVAPEEQNVIRVVVETIGGVRGLPELWGDLYPGEGPAVPERSRTCPPRAGRSPCGGENADWYAQSRCVASVPSWNGSMRSPRGAG